MVLDTTYHRDIMHYESEIWSCADLLISSGIKQSKFPDYMMPVFALIMLEGRMLNEIRDIEESEGLNRFDNPEEFLEAFRDRGCGYNEYIVIQGKCGKIDDIVEKIETKIERLKELKRSLINEAVTGQRAIKISMCI